MKLPSRLQGLLRVAGLTLGVATAACGDPIGPTDVVWIEPDTISLAVGEQLRLRVVVRSADGREREIDADRWESPHPEIAAVGSGNGVIQGVDPGFTTVTATVSGERLDAFVAVGPVTFRNIDSVALALYENAGPLAVRLTAPALALDDRTIDTNLPQAPTRWTSTAYIGTRRYRSQIYPSGETSGHYEGGGPVELSRAVRPKGVQRILNVIVDYGDTDIRDRINNWVAAQDSINGDHLALARALGYPSPIVQFENTNVVIDRDSVRDPENPDSVLANVLLLGHDPDTYDVVVSIAMTPTIGVGYARLLANVVVVGCHCPSPGQDSVTRLTQETLHNLARVVYHHEIGHLWGWEHEWGGGPKGTRIITYPALFGWTDTDSDGVLEVIDDTPYGISPADTGGLGIGGRNSVSQGGSRKKRS